MASFGVVFAVMAIALVWIVSTLSMIAAGAEDDIAFVNSAAVTTAVAVLAALPVWFAGLAGLM